MDHIEYSLVIPAHNEEGCIEDTVLGLAKILDQNQIRYEILVVDDHSRDQTSSILDRLHSGNPHIRVVSNTGPGGFGLAVRFGLNRAQGEYVAVVMADASDPPEDVLKFYKVAKNTGVDCVFGSRFIKGGKVIDYPVHKLVLNRMANLFISVLFGLRYNDTTNAFKLYHRKVLQGIQPFLSHHFNLTVELPLKSIIRGYTFTVVPNSWINRKAGVSKLKIREMGSRYLFIVLYCFIEKYLSRGDYRKQKYEESQSQSKSHNDENQSSISKSNLTAKNSRPENQINL